MFTFRSAISHKSGSKGRKISLAVYNEDDANDLSDLGIGTSSASGKSSLSEDYDNHSVIVSWQMNLKIIHMTSGFQSKPKYCAKEFIRVTQSQCGLLHIISYHHSVV